MWSYLFLLSALHLNHAIAHNRAPRQAECVTPDNKTGGCIELRSCYELNNLFIKHEKNSSVKSFLRQSQCAPYVRGQSPKVCCPKPVQQSPTMGRSVPECRKNELHRDRILGAQRPELGRWPWMAALRYRIKNKNTEEYDFKCAGSLISDQWVLTAAHCVLHLPSNHELVAVRLGDLDLDKSVQDNSTEIDVSIQDIVPHLEYSRSPYINDIALLRLSTPIKFTNNIRPVCVLKGAEYVADKFYDRKIPFIMGWGFAHQRWSSSQLQETGIRMVNNTKCAQLYQQDRLSLIDEKVLCTGEPGKDSCQGNFGGPLIFPIVTERTYFIGGIKSYGIGCANDRYPGVYTRVAAFTDWIEQVTKLTF